MVQKREGRKVGEMSGHPVEVRENPNVLGLVGLAIGVAIIWAVAGIGLQAFAASRGKVDLGWDR